MRRECNKFWKSNEWLKNEKMKEWKMWKWMLKIVKVIGNDEMYVENAVNVKEILKAVKCRKK